MSRFWPSALLIAVLLCVLFVPLAARANERHFSYNLRIGGARPGREGDRGLVDVPQWPGHPCTRFDERLEFEVGLVPSLQTALYVNITAVGRGVNGELATGTELSVSNEWKWRVLDGAVDGTGWRSTAR
jgi:hypothetical protein